MSGDKTGVKQEGNKTGVNPPVWTHSSFPHRILNKVGLASPGGLR
jgi:hypothetical protein